MGCPICGAATAPGKPCNAHLPLGEDSFLPGPPEGVKTEAELEAERERRRLASQQNIYKAILARQRQGALREAIRVGAVDDIDVIMGRTPYEAIIQKWTVERLLMACRKIKKVRTHNILVELDLPPSKKVKDLSWEQRQKIAELVKVTRDIWT